MSTIDEIKERLDILTPDCVEITDDSASHAGHAGAAAGGGHYDVMIVSARFSGISKVARHRLVYSALAPLMQHKIHALALRTYAPGEV